MANPVIEVEGLVTKFGSQVVHDRLSLTLYENEILGLVGGSGSGKSVLLRSIIGLMPVREGSVKIYGKSGIQADSGKNWGVLFQNGALFSGLTVLDNITLPIRENFDLPEDEMEQLALKKMEMVGLKSDVAYKKPSELSGGMVKRAALARALALDPRILFLDEPTAHFDVRSEQEFLERLKAMRDEKMTIIISTHRLSLLGMVDRLLLFDNGRLVADGPRDQVLARLQGKPPVPEPTLTQRATLVQKPNVV